MGGCVKHQLGFDFFFGKFVFFVLLFAVVHVSKKKLKMDMGVGGWVSDQSEFLSDFLIFFNLTKPLKGLHWLPISQRIEYQILTTVYRSLRGHAPDYLKDMLGHYNHGRTLRSKSFHNLEVPRARDAYGSRDFPIYGTRLWNKLPCPMNKATTLEAFKNTLKHI